MTSDRIVDPANVCRSTENLEWWQTVLREEIWPVISTLVNINDKIFMHHVNPTHCDGVAHEWPNAKLYWRWNGHLSPHEGLVWSPDWETCKCFIGVSLKEQVHSIKHTTLAELKEKTRDMMSSIQKWLIMKSDDTVPTRLEMLAAQPCAHREL